MCVSVCRCKPRFLFNLCMFFGCVQDTVKRTLSGIGDLSSSATQETPLDALVAATHRKSSGLSLSALEPVRVEDSGPLLGALPAFVSLPFLYAEGHFFLSHISFWIACGSYSTRKEEKSFSDSTFRHGSNPMRRVWYRTISQG